MKMINKLIPIACSLLLLVGCLSGEKDQKDAVKPEAPFVWEGANLYFLLTDRFNNGDPSNDVNYDRTSETAVLRGFEGGDIKGVTQKIEAGYFTDLGVNAIWLSPIVEQIHGGTDEGTGMTYGFHGYWTKDWTSLDPNFGTSADLKELVEIAHSKGIRIVLDAVINHTGPVTDIDTVWPKEWVRTSPACEFKDYESTVTCTLVKNLPDILTESNEEVVLPPQLVEKWKAEGRYDEEVAELDTFFTRTGYTRAPRFYIMKWLTDYITDYGIDGYRVDTVKHTEEYVWQEFRKECDYSFEQWKMNHPQDVLDDTNFYMVGEIYNYGISTGKNYDFGDRKVNYFEDSFSSLINFEFKWDAAKVSYEELFSKNAQILKDSLSGFGTLNYLTSHDDGSPYDAGRVKTYKTGTLLLLSPGTAQVYYGDESARTLIVEGAQGDATLRSKMNWTSIANESKTKDLLLHWQKLGKFRSNHPSVGAGAHEMISEVPYVFQRDYSKRSYNDKVIVGLDLPKGVKEIDVLEVFKEGAQLRDAYSGTETSVVDGSVIFTSDFDIVLLEMKRISPN
jgi:alpha-amylase